MAQTLALVVLFMAVVAMLPWLVRRMQLRQGATGTTGTALRVLSQVAIGPQQRVMTIEVHDAGQRNVLVLGVTAQQVQCLHVLGKTEAAPLASAAPPVEHRNADFATHMAVVHKP